MAHRFALRVYYEDTDLAGIVYHANYLKFIERGRTEALLALGLDQAELRARSGIVLAVRRLEAEFLAAARFQDQLLVTTQARAIRGAQADLAQTVARDGVMLFRALVEVVALGPDGRAVRMPELVRAALRALAS